jgi:hypothetical protein
MSIVLCLVQGKPLKRFCLAAVLGRRILRLADDTLFGARGVPGAQVFPGQGGDYVLSAY